MRYLLFLAFLMLTHFCARSQNIRPKWVDDLKGNTGSSEAYYLAVDKQNNIYVAGQFQGTVDFDPSAGVKNLTSVGQQDIFLGKYKPDGTLIWVESFGGSNVDYPYSVAKDKDGNVTVAGVFFSANLDADPGPGVYDLSNPSGYPAAFIIHLDTNGNFLWANSFAGPGSSGVFHVATDSQDNVIITSAFSETLTIGDSTYRAAGSSNGLIVKYGVTGNLLWSIRLRGSLIGGGNDNDVAWGVAVDSQDNIVISGSIDSTVNFNPLGAAYNLTAANDTYSAFVAKYNPVGILTWVKGINSLSENSFANSTVCIDPKNDIYIGVPFNGSIIFDSTVLTAPVNNGSNLSFAKYSPAGKLLYAKSIGGQGNLSYNGIIANDKNSNIYMTGYFTGPVNFNPNPGKVENLSPHGRQDLFVAKYDSLGNYVYAFNPGSGSCYSLGSGIAVDSSNNVDVVGSFCSTVNFDPSGCSSKSLTASAGSDAFIAQYASFGIANNTITTPTVSIFCVSGVPAAITGSLPTGGSGTYTYQWQSSTDSVQFVNISGATGQSYTPAVLTATTYFQRIVSSDTCTTPAISNVVKLTISAPPSAPVIHGYTTCAGSTATLSVALPQPGLTYNWYTSATAGTLLYTGVSFTTPALTAGTTFYAEAANGTTCTSAPTAVAVTIVQPLAATVVTVGTTTSSSVAFSWTAVPGATGYQVSTDGGQTYSAPGPGATGLTDTVSGLQGGQSITLLVQAAGVIDCQTSAASAAVTGTAISPTDDIIYVPNAITPNGGQNAQAHVHGINIQSLNFSVYDQWGEMLFTTNSVQNGWDGTYKGTKEPVGVYVYYLEAVMNDGQRITKKGTITIIR